MHVRACVMCVCVAQDREGARADEAAAQLAALRRRCERLNGERAELTAMLEGCGVMRVLARGVWRTRVVLSLLERRLAAAQTESHQRAVELQLARSTTSRLRQGQLDTQVLAGGG